MEKRKASNPAVKVIVKRLPYGKSFLRLVGTNIPEELKTLLVKDFGDADRIEVVKHEVSSQ